MPTKPSTVFDRPLRNNSGSMTDERALQAIALVKEKRPDLWQKFTEHEKNNEGYRDIAEDLDQLFVAEMNAKSVTECGDLCFEIRKEVRRQAKLPY